MKGSTSSSGEGNDERRSVLYNQLLIEEVLLFYKICKTKGTPWTIMIEYFETAIDRLISLKNIDLLSKITLDLMETFKFKLNDILAE